MFRDNFPQRSLEPLEGICLVVGWRMKSLDLALFPLICVSLGPLIPLELRLYEAAPSRSCPFLAYFVQHLSRYFGENLDRLLKYSGAIQVHF